MSDQRFSRSTWWNKFGKLKVKHNIGRFLQHVKTEITKQSIAMYFYLGWCYVQTDVE